MKSLSIPLASGARIAESYGHWTITWTDEDFGPQSATGAINAILSGVDRLRATSELVMALDACPDLCGLAASVHEIHRIRAMSDDEAFPLLVDLRGSIYPEAIRAIAGRELLRRNNLGDQPAVCDASEVVG